VFLEDQKKPVFASPDINSSPSDLDVCSIGKSKKESLKKAEQSKNLSITVKRYFQEDSGKKVNDDDNSFQEKKTTKGEYISEDEKNSYDKSQEFKSKFAYFENKFKSKANNNKKSFFKNFFSGFLKNNDKVNKEEISSEGYANIQTGELEEEEDSDDLGEGGKPPNLEGIWK
jgi:hypothetical protein